MKQIFLWFSGIVLTLFAACSVDDESLTAQPQVPSSTITTQLNAYKREVQRSSAEVAECVRNFEQQLGIIGQPTRSHAVGKLMVKPLVVQSSMTRVSLSAQSQAADTLLYLCELQDSTGFCLVSGDKRTNDILAYVPEGKFDAEEVMNVPGLSLFLELLPKYLENQITERQAQLDSLKANLGEIATRGRITYGNGNREEIADSKWETTEHAEAFLSTVWSQRSPYNNAAPLIEGRRALVGCVAIAVGQLMAYHKTPSKIEGANIVWDDILNSNNAWKDNVSFLLRSIGDQLNNKWGVEATGAYHKDVPIVLKHYGYNVPYPSTPDFSQVIQSLKENKPVIVSGALKKKIVEWNILFWKKQHVSYPDGHEWIIDGYVNQQYPYMYSKERNAYRCYFRTLAHCNWGWGWAYNGYFDASVFDSAKPRQVTLPPNTRAHQLTAFQYGLEYLTHVTP